MARSDYQCRDCQVVIEYEKPFGESFPAEMPCAQCNGTLVRSFSPVVTAIAEGNNGITYHPSKFTPGGKKRRKRLT